MKINKPVFNRFPIIFTLIGAILFVFFIYWQGLYGPFMLDDLPSIEAAQLTNFTWQQLFEISLQNDSGPIGRPISVASFALNHYFSGLNPFYYKLVNLIIHIVCGIAIGFLSYLLMKFLPKAKRLAKFIGFFTALLWLIHPLQVSTVLYPVQRMTQLCHLFILLGLNTYLCGRIKQLTQKPHSQAIIWLSYIVFFPLAILSKETGILFPFYVLITEIFILKFHGKPSDSRQLKWFHLSLCLGLFLCAAIYYWYHLDTYLALFADKKISLGDRILTQLNVLVFYLKLIIVPQLSDMGLYHDDFKVVTSINVQTVLCTLVLVSAAMLMYFARKKAPIIAFGIAWYFVSHAIESTILPLEMVFEHRNYLASFGLLLMFTYYFIPLVQKADKAPRRIYYSFSILFILLLATITYQRSYIWSSSVKFLQESRIQHPLSPRVHIEIANLFLQEQEYEAAFAELNEAARLDPNNAGIALHKILIYCRLQYVPPSIYEEAKQKIKQGAITPYVITVLDTMVQNMFNKQCPSIDKKKIIELIRTCYENPYLRYKPRFKAVLYHLEAGLELLNTNVDKSRYLLLESYKAYPKRIEPLLQKAYLEMQYNMLPEAQASVLYAHEQLAKNKSAKAKLLKLDSAMQSVKKQSEQMRKE